MRLVVRSHHFWILVALLVLFSVVAWHADSRSILILTNSLVLVFSTAVGIAYVPVAVRAIRDQTVSDQATRVKHIALGICLAWFFSAMWRSFSLMWILSGEDPAWINNDIVGFCQLMVATGAAYHLSSPGAVANLGLRQSHPGWLVGGTAAASLALAALLAYAPPDMSGVAALVKPYLPR